MSRKRMPLHALAFKGANHEMLQTQAQVHIQNDARRQDLDNDPEQEQRSAARGATKSGKYHVHCPSFVYHTTTSPERTILLLVLTRTKSELGLPRSKTCKN